MKSDVARNFPPHLLGHPIRRFRYKSRPAKLGTNRIYVPRNALQTSRVSRSCLVGSVAFAQPLVMSRSQSAGKREAFDLLPQPLVFYDARNKVLAILFRNFASPVTTSSHDELSASRRPARLCYRFGVIRSRNPPIGANFLSPIDAS